MKIAVVTCYSDPNNVRAAHLRAALKATTGNRVFIVCNTRRGWLRYPEVILALWRLRRKKRPDAYLLTFRGQEILPFVLRIAGKKTPVWFDECVVPIRYVQAEDFGSGLGRRLQRTITRRSISSYRRWLHRCRGIIVESEAQADTSARLAGVNLSNYSVIATPAAATDGLSTTERQLSRLIADAAA